MRINEIVIDDDDLLLDILIDHIALSIKDMYDSVSDKSDKFRVDSMEAFAPNRKTAILNKCVELLEKAELLYTHNQQTIRILNYLITYLSENQ